MSTVRDGLIADTYFVSRRSELTPLPQTMKQFPAPDMGGKGIAVAVGCLFVTFGWIGACLELLIFIVLVATTKRVSIGSIAAAAACPFFALYFFWGDWLAWLFCTVAGLTVVWAHRENIKRLRAGTESRIGDKGKKKEA